MTITNYIAYGDNAVATSRKYINTVVAPAEWDGLLGPVTCRGHLNFVSLSRSACTYLRCSTVFAYYCCYCFQRVASKIKRSRSCQIVLAGLQTQRFVSLGTVRGRITPLLNQPDSNADTHPFSSHPALTWNSCMGLGIVHLCDRPNCSPTIARPHSGFCWFAAVEAAATRSLWLRVPPISKGAADRLLTALVILVQAAAASHWLRALVGHTTWAREPFLRRKSGG